METRVLVEIEAQLKRKRKPTMPHTLESHLPKAKNQKPLVPPLSKSTNEAERKRISEMLRKEAPEPPRKSMPQHSPKK